MPRRRKKDPIDHFLEIIPVLGGLLFLSWTFVPGFKQTLGGFLVLLAAVAGALLLLGLGFLYWKKQRQSYAELNSFPSPSSPPRVPPVTPTLSVREPFSPQWNLELLRSLDWKGFEDLVAAFASHVGHVGKTTRLGPDGGIDVHIYEPDNPHPVMIVQCKAWENRLVGVSPIRELYGVMAAEQVKEGAFFTTGDFTSEALTFARGKPLDLVNGVEFLTRIGQLPVAAQTELLEFATRGDYATPSCPSCGDKMLLRTAKTGANAGNTFWGCRNYPRCKRTFQKKQG